MGVIASLYACCAGPQAARLLMVGLDAAGKTTVLYELALGQVVETEPTVGFNVETFLHRNILMTIWDLGGQERLRKLWNHFSVTKTHGVIFVVDSSDPERLEDAREELQAMLENRDLRDACLLIYANKQDMPEALSAGDVAAKLGLCRIRDRPWFIQPAIATKCQGVKEGLDWMANAVMHRSQRCI
eukprot:gb/GFBE01006312.1/.p1 GENE.gb/GFBE01006312.1/~~gb/GFBE01006312.1/.p1  ORF type:complete len:186 (+),score=52.99 gb/GFBE01006312.1/:1-558(+)